MPGVWSFFVGESSDSVVRGCDKSDGKTDGCEEVSKNLKFDPPPGKRDLGGRSKPDSGDSAKKNTTDAPLPDLPLPDKLPEGGMPALPEGGLPPDFARNLSGWRGNSDKPKTEEKPMKGTSCYCNMDLCNEAGVSTLQYSGSSYFIVIGVLALTALITLSAANDDDY